MSNIIISAIVAMARNHVIGKDNTLIWHLPEDLKHFKRTTMGKPILMGRKSYESLGKPLAGRPNIVVSRSCDHFSAMEDVTPDAPSSIPDGPYVCASLEDGIILAQKMAQELGVEEIFITGGGEIYKQSLPWVQRLYLTILDRTYVGDTVFPDFDWTKWKTLAEVHHAADPVKDRPAFTIYTLERIAETMPSGSP